MTDDEQTMVDDCERRSEKLSDNEARFIDDISGQDWALTGPQSEWLEKIWERVTADG